MRAFLLMLNSICLNMQREMAYKKTFVRYISHEVRSPLSTTSLGLDCMREILGGQQPLDRSELMELATDCMTTCTVAIQTLSDLLLYDKIESNMMQLEKMDVPCMHFLDQCCHPMEKQIKYAGLSWTTCISSQVRRAVMRADLHKMEQVLRNFITNAVKFTPAGGTITLRAVIYHAGSNKANELFRMTTGSQKPQQVVNPIDQEPNNSPVAMDEVEELEEEEGEAMGSQQNLSKVSFRDEEINNNNNNKESIDELQQEEALEVVAELNGTEEEYVDGISNATSTKSFKFGEFAALSSEDLRFRCEVSDTGPGISMVCLREI